MTGVPACSPTCLATWTLWRIWGRSKLGYGPFPNGLIPFAVIGFVVLRRKRAIVYPLVSLAVVVTLVAIGEAGVLRFRAPFEDAFVVMAGIGLHRALIWGRHQMGREPRSRFLENRCGHSRRSPALVLSWVDGVPTPRAGGLQVLDHRRNYLPAARVSLRRSWRTILVAG